MVTPDYLRGLCSPSLSLAPTRDNSSVSSPHPDAELLSAATQRYYVKVRHLPFSSTHSSSHYSSISDDPSTT